MTKNFVLYICLFAGLCALYGPSLSHMLPASVKRAFVNAFKVLQIKNHSVLSSSWN
jgi:hypothetical protein